MKNDIPTMKFSSLNKAIFEQMDLPDNAVVADLGCRDAGFLLGFVQAFPGKIKKALGVDMKDKCFGNIPFTEPIELRVMNCGEKLNLPDNSFDFVFSKDMFECVADKALLVNEIHRILKPGGVVICVNCDWDSIVYNGENKELIAKAIHAYAVTKQAWMDELDSWIGRRMYGIFNSSGLFESSVTVHNVVETQYKEGFFGFDFSHHIGWLAEENTGALTGEEYREFICNLEAGPDRVEILKPFLDGIGTKGIAVNFDSGNLIMYVNENPAAAVRKLGSYIVHTHAKDARRIIRTKKELLENPDCALGQEYPLGAGWVNFPEYMAALDEIGYKGFLTIERECGCSVREDISAAVCYLRSIIESC